MLQARNSNPANSKQPKQTLTWMRYTQITLSSSSFQVTVEHSESASFTNWSAGVYVPSCTYSKGSSHNTTKKTTTELTQRPQAVQQVNGLDSSLRLAHLPASAAVHMCSPVQHAAADMPVLLEHEPCYCGSCRHHCCRSIKECTGQTTATAAQPSLWPTCSCC